MVDSQQQALSLCSLHSHHVSAHWNSWHMSIISPILGRLSRAGLCTGCRNCPHAAGSREITDVVMNSRLLTGQHRLRSRSPRQHQAPALPIKCMPSNAWRSAVAAKLSQPRRCSYSEEWFKCLCPCWGSPLFLFSKLVHITGSLWLCPTMSMAVKFHYCLKKMRQSDIQESQLKVKQLLV